MLLSLFVVSQLFILILLRSFVFMLFSFVIFFYIFYFFFFFFFQAEDGIRDDLVTGVQTCALPIYPEDDVDDAREGAIAFLHDAKTRELGLHLGDEPIGKRCDRGPSEDDVHASLVPGASVRPATSSRAERGFLPSTWARTISIAPSAQATRTPVASATTMVPGSAATRNAERWLARTFRSLPPTCVKAPRQGDMPRTWSLTAAPGRFHSMPPRCLS